uniref:Leiomodin-3 n=1 Tax=Cyclopterus lumpus TaxID=8103 RepID=A0A8C2ZZP4_CYCLU
MANDSISCVCCAAGDVTHRHPTCCCQSCTLLCLKQLSSQRILMTSNDLEDLNEEDFDEDELLAMLSPEELKELQSEMDIIIAPDERVPVGQRQKNQTEKAPTGTFDHRALVGHLHWEKESNRMLEEERVPVTLLPSEETEKKHEDVAEEDVEYEMIEEVTEEEAVDGTGGEEMIEIIEEMIEEVDERDEKDKRVDVKDEEGLKSPSTSQAEEKEGIKTTDSSLPKEASEEPEINDTNDKLPQKEERKINKLNIPKLAFNNIKMTSRPSGNETNLESTLDKVRNNNPSIAEVNLNNIENIPKEMLLDYVNALKKNKHVKTFSIANTGVDENIAYNLANMLRENRGITTLNIESNFVTGKGIVAIVRCLQFNETLTELRFHNQRHMLGHHSEMEISRLLKANNTLLKLGYHFEQPGPRMVVTNLLTRNLDRQRQLRKEEQRQQQAKEQRELMQMYESSLNLPPGLLEMLGYVPPLELLQECGLPEPQKQLKHKSAPTQPGAEPATALRDVQLKRTPKKRDPFLDLDPRDNKGPERASFQLRKTPKLRDAGGGALSDEKANLSDVIKTLKPVPRRRSAAKVDVTPRDQLLGEIKNSGVAYLKSVSIREFIQ